MINPERVKLWIESLRSGKFKQHRRYLHCEDGWCPLGLACEVYRIHNTQSKAKWIRDPDGYFFQFKGARYTLPVDVHQWFGVAFNPVIRVDGHEVTVTHLNDGSSAELNNRKFSFLEIADLLEAKYFPQPTN